MNKCQRARGTYNKYVYVINYRVMIICNKYIYPYVLQIYYCTIIFYYSILLHYNIYIDIEQRHRPYLTRFLRFYRHIIL